MADQKIFPLELLQNYELVHCSAKIKKSFNNVPSDVDLHYSDWKLPFFIQRGHYTWPVLTPDTNKFYNGDTASKTRYINLKIAGCS